MILPGVDPEVRCHQPGDTVWIVKQNGEVDSTSVLSTSVEICQDTRPAETRGPAPFHLVPRGYWLNACKFNQKEMVHFFHSDEVFATKEDAEASVEWWVTSRIDEVTWRMAVGTRPVCGKATAELGELGRCCRRVEIVRDMLLTSKDVGGLRGRDRAFIRDFYGTHEYPWQSGARPAYLDKVLEELHIRIVHRISVLNKPS